MQLYSGVLALELISRVELSSTSNRNMVSVQVSKLPISALFQARSEIGRGIRRIKKLEP